jgi:hypothetical protein
MEKVLRLKRLSQGLMTLFAFAVYLLCAQAAAADNRELCKKLSQAKEPTLYLLDGAGKLSAGPIDFGRFAAHRDLVSDYEVAKTPYKLVLFPKSVSIVDTMKCNFCLDLKKIAPVCPGSTSYMVGVGLSFRAKGGKRPFKDAGPINLEFETADSPYPVPVKIAFKDQMQGELIEP